MYAGARSAARLQLQAISALQQTQHRNTMCSQLSTPQQQPCPSQSARCVMIWAYIQTLTSKTPAMEDTVRHLLSQLPRQRSSCWRPQDSDLISTQRVATPTVQPDDGKPPKWQALPTSPATSHQPRLPGAGRPGTRRSVKCPRRWGRRWKTPSSQPRATQ